MKAREQAISMLRSCSRHSAQVSVAQAHRDLIAAMGALVQEFRIEFDVPGVRYWENVEIRQHLSTVPGEQLQHPVENWVELSRVEFVSRQGIWHSYDRDSL